MHWKAGRIILLPKSETWLVGFTFSAVLTSAFADHRRMKAEGLNFLYVAISVDYSFYRRRSNQTKDRTAGNASRQICSYYTSNMHMILVLQSYHRYSNWANSNFMMPFSALANIKAVQNCLPLNLQDLTRSM